LNLLLIPKSVKPFSPPSGNFQLALLPRLWDLVRLGAAVWAPAFWRGHLGAKPVWAPALLATDVWAPKRLFDGVCPEFV